MTELPKVIFKLVDMQTGRAIHEEFDEVFDGDL
jgi:hypothetical protein